MPPWQQPTDANLCPERSEGAVLVWEAGLGISRRPQLGAHR